MNRLTIKKEDGSYTVAGGDNKKAVERLGAFEDALWELTDEMARIPEELAQLRNSGKEKTVRYREMVARKLITNSIYVFFEEHKLL